MGTSQSVLELIAAARADAKACEERIADIRDLADGQDGSDTQADDLRAATVALELAAVDVFSLFEARMQHHFRRGPFSRKLKSLLLDAGQTDLADRFQQYYLTINVLKHGKGASYRELLKTPTALFGVKPSEEIADGDATEGLVDVTVPGFFDGLTTTLVEAYHFLETK